MPHSSASLPAFSTRDFTALLLAGGRSTRMGFDKASMMVDGRPLWERQLATLRATNPRELLISGHPEGPYRNAGIPVVPDDVPGLGPLGGLATALRVAQRPFVLVLAIDLPDIPAEWLNRLLQRGPAIPVSAGEIEPLAALYPRAAASIAVRLLEERQLSLRRFVQELFDSGLAQPLVLTPEEAPLFRNLNTPENLMQRHSSKLI